MALLWFYITQIFGKFEIPSSDQICGDETLKTYCLKTVGFIEIFTLASFLAIIFVGFKYRKKLQFLLKKTFVLLIGIVSCFFFADIALTQISEPIKFGIEWFVLSFNLWGFLLLNLFVYALVFQERQKIVIRTIYIITCIFTGLFAATGRGNIEQITLIAGGLFGKVTWDFLWLSEGFRLFSALVIISFVLGFYSVIVKWVVHGKFSLKMVFKDMVFCAVIFPAFLIPVISIFIGEKFNDRDVKEAQDYINIVTKRVNKFYYENGEYPKFVENILPEGESPRLLKRHEFFTSGVRGTYYFSRKEKYCFIFQNPTRKFGYYSMTSERGWRFAPETGEFDDVYVNLCDESLTTYEDLISNHLGVSKGDDYVGQIKSISGEIYVPAESKKATGLLEQKLDEAGKNDPTIFNHFNDAFSPPVSKPSLLVPTPGQK